MLISSYSFDETPIHRAKPGFKLLLLILTCSALFIGESWIKMCFVGTLVASLYVVAKISTENVIASLRPAFWVLTLIFWIQFYLSGWEVAAFVVVRFIIMIMSASLLTLTTKTSDLIESMESWFRLLCSEKPAENISLALSLCIRFIPMVRKTYGEVKEAQYARGLGGDWRALVTPTIIRTLKSADEISQAIVARSSSTLHSKD